MEKHGFKRITIPEAHYLKHVGSKMDVKVSFGIVNAYPVIHIEDHEFRSFTSARQYLQHVATQIVDTEVRS